MSTPTKDQLKKRSKELALILQEKYGIKVVNGHCLEIVSKLFGFKDWNTASAGAKPKPDAVVPRKIGKLIEALQAFNPEQDLTIIGEELLPAEYDRDGMTAPERVRRNEYAVVINTNEEDGSCDFGLISTASLFEDDSNQMVFRAINLLEQAKADPEEDELTPETGP